MRPKIASFSLDSTVHFVRNNISSEGIEQYGSGSNAVSLCYHPKVSEPQAVSSSHRGDSFYPSFSSER